MPGHKLRHQIYKCYKDDPYLSFYGAGAGNRIDFKEDALKPYLYTIVVESSKTEYYFSEKLIDAIGCYCIPIYWGYFPKFLDSSGVLQFDSLVEFNSIIRFIKNEDRVVLQQMTVGSRLVNSHLSRAYHRVERHILEVLQRRNYV